MNMIAKMRTLLADFIGHSLSRYVGFTMLTKFAAVILVAYSDVAVGAMPYAGTYNGGNIPGFINYSSDRNTIFFNTESKHIQTVFMDTIWPFDPTLRFLSSDPLVKYQLDYKPVTINNVMMVALSDLAKLYAPYFRFTANDKALTVIHHFFNKKLVAGSGTRRPGVECTKIVTEGIFSIGGTSASVTVSTFKPANTTTVDSAALATKVGPNAVSLDFAPTVANGVIYVPVASFMRAFGKTITTYTASRGYIAVSSVDPADTTNDLFNPNYNSNTPYPYAAITPYRVTYMNSVLDGTKTKGTFWNGFWLGDITVFTGAYDANEKDITEVKTVNRILPYRLYIPKNYNPKVPSKFAFLLHGQTGNENAPIERINGHYSNQPSPLPGCVHDSFENYSDVYNYMVLSPNGWTHGPAWGKGPGEQSILGAYNLVKSKYNIDPDRTFIMGNSLGGAGTLGFAARHAEMFKAMAPSAPAPGKPTGAAFKGAVLDLPTLLIQGTKDATIPYKETVDYFINELKGVLRNITFMTIEEGDHSTAWGSALQAIYEFFDRALKPAPRHDVKEVSFRAGSPVAHQQVSTNQAQKLVLTTAPKYADDGITLMATLTDLARIYGPNFKYYNIYAYNNDPGTLTNVITAIYDNVSVNIKVGDTFLRAGSAFHAGDSKTRSTKIAADDPSIDPRTLSVAPYTSEGNVFVPVVEFMKLFNKSVLIY